MSLHHLALGAQNVHTLADFYTCVLRLPETKRFHTDSGSLRSVWLRLGDGVLMVEQSTAPPRDVRGIGGGLFLVAIRWPEGLSHARRWLADHGVEVEDQSEFSLYFRDPEGNRAALSVYPLDPSP